MSESVGDIVGFLRLDASNWSAEIDRAAAKADSLSRHDPKITIRTNAKEALTQLEAVAVATKRLQDAQARVSVAQARKTQVDNNSTASLKQRLSAENGLTGALRNEELASIRLAAAHAKVNASNEEIVKSTDKAKHSTGGLLAAVAALSPAVVPLAAVAAAGFGALAAGAGVAALAVGGIKKELEQGTAVGQAYRKEFDLLKTDVASLQHTAADAFVGSTVRGVTTLHAFMPELTAQTRDLSVYMGDAAVHVEGGLLSGLHTAAPLISQLAGDADRAAVAFDRWSSGGGGAGFVSFLQQNLPGIEQDLGQVSGLVGRILASGAGTGVGLLSTIGLLAQALNSIPLPVLQTAVPLLVSLYGAAKLFRGLDSVAGAVGKFNTSLSGLGVGMGAASAGAGLLGGAVVGLGLIFSEHAADQAKQTALTKDYAAALKDSNGALNESVRSKVLASLVDDNLIKTAAKYKISQVELTDAITGSNAAYQRFINDTKGAGDLGAGATFVKSIAAQRKAFQDATDFQKRYTDAVAADAAAQKNAAGLLLTTASSFDRLAGSTGLAGDVVQRYAGLVGITKDAVDNGRVTQDALNKAVGDVSTVYGTATASTESYLAAVQTFASSAGTAADKAALIGATLKASQGDALGFAATMTSVFAANTNLTKSFADQAAAVKAGSLAFTDTEKAAINLKTGVIDFSRTGAGPLITQLQAMQDAATAAAAATYQHEVATKGAATAAADAAAIFKGETYDALLKDAGALGLTKDQAKKLADTYFAMPKTVTTKVIDIGTQTVIDTLGKIGLQLSYLTNHPWATAVTANTNDAQVKLDAVFARLQAMTATQWQAYVNVGYQYSSLDPTQHGIPGSAMGGAIQGYARGSYAGAVSGPGSGTNDLAGIYRLSNGEHVLTASDVAKMGGQNSVYALRQAVQSGTALRAPLMPRPDMPRLTAAGPVRTMPATVQVAFPSALVLRLDDGTSFTAHVEGIAGKVTTQATAEQANNLSYRN